MLKKIKLIKLKGFTIIEILVVVAILAMLVTVVIVTVRFTYHKARDEKKEGNIVGVKNAMEMYKDKYGEYPKGVDPTAYPELGCPSHRCINYGCQPECIEPVLQEFSSGVSASNYSYVRGADGQTDRGYAMKITWDDGTSCKTGAQVYPGWWGTGCPLCDF